MQQVKYSLYFKVLTRDHSNSKQSLKNHLTKWKNATSDRINLNIIENGPKLDLIDTPKCNFQFVFLLWHEEQLFVKKEVALYKGKNIVVKANVAENNIFLSGLLTRSKRMCPSG